MTTVARDPSSGVKSITILTVGVTVIVRVCNLITPIKVYIVLGLGFGVRVRI